ncbi:hypothetical protein [Pectinatus frisingensis]|uniref:hypothetical protein n=1 Tax=Pectinatus frisingensis TaxID=865 RepID=UPI003D8071E3
MEDRLNSINKVSVADNVHKALDIAGFIPGIGSFSEGANSLLYAFQGEKGEAALAALSAILGIKAVKVLKGGIQYLKIIPESGEASKALKELYDAEKTAGNTGHVIEVTAESGKASSTVAYIFDETAGTFKTSTGQVVPLEKIGSEVATDANTAFFWSGNTQGVGGSNVAAGIAQSQGGVTLESLLARKGIEMPAWDPSNPASVNTWQTVSQMYASQVSGVVRAVIGDSLRPGAVWTDYELPALMKNQNVTQIITIDPATGAQKVIFTR